MAKQAVLIRGEGIDERFVWNYVHFHPKKTISTGPLTAVFFDFPSGMRKTWNKWIPSKGKPPRGNPDSSDALRTIDTGGGVMRATVLDLYDWVKRQPPGSIITMQTFTHAWYQGPVLWHAPRDVTTPRDKPRSPTDTEFRIRDLYGSNDLTGSELVRFNASFTDDALIKFWGCNHEQDKVDIVEYYLAAERQKRQQSKMAHLRDYMTFVESTFTVHLARALGRTLWAAPAGWGTDWAFDNTVYRHEFPPRFERGDRWWAPTPNFKKAHRAFFTRVLKAQIDGARFVGYNAAWLDDVQRVLTNAGAAASPVKTPRDLQQELLDQIVTPFG